MNPTTNLDSISETLANAHLGHRQSHKALTLWPLIRDVSAAAGASGFVCLKDAFDAGWIDLDEVGDDGSVPHVKVTNRGEQPVLVLFGEGLIGAKQDRAVNASFLVPARSELVIDVSCVEAGRWSSPLGERFSSGDSVVSASLRKAMAANVTDSRRTGGSFDADQDAVWNGVSKRLTLSGTDSWSEAYGDYLESRSSDLDEIGRAFQCVDGQVGFVAAIGDEIEGLELVGDPGVFARVFQSLLKAYAIDAVDAAWLRDESPDEAAHRFDTPESFLQTLAQAPVTAGPSLGVGQDLRVEGESVSGCALECDGEIVHMTAFPRRRPSGHGRKPTWDAAQEDADAAPQRHSRRKAA